MIKIAGFLFVWGGGTAAGFWKARQYRQRAEQLRQFVAAFVMFESMIRFGAHSMEHIARTIADQITAPVGTLFRQFADKLTEWEQEAGQLWVQFMEQTALTVTAQDRAILQQAGAMLGRSAKEAESEKLRMVIRQLEQQRESAESEAGRFASLAQSGGVAGGLMAAILFY